MQLLIELILLAMLALTAALYPLRRQPKLVILMTPILAGLVSLAYWEWGSWPAWQRYQQQLAAQERAQKVLKSFHNPQELIDELKRRVENEPQQAQGWYLLGRLYASQAQWALALQAFERAHKLKPKSVKMLINVVESRIALNDGHLDGESQVLLKKLLEKNPEQPDALAMFAMDAYTQKHYAEAIHYWQKLLNQVPPQSQAASALRQAIARAEEGGKRS